MLDSFYLASKALQNFHVYLPISDIFKINVIIKS